LKQPQTNLTIWWCKGLTQIEIAASPQEIAAQNNFSKPGEKIKTIRLLVVRRWILDIKDRITAHGDPEKFHTSAWASKINF